MTTATDDPSLSQDETAGTKERRRKDKPPAVESRPAKSLTEWQQALRTADLPLNTKGFLMVVSSYADWKTGEHARPGKRLLTECASRRRQPTGTPS